MSVVLVVGSEEELSSGAAWCATLATAAGTSAQVIVLGEDRKTLAEHAKRRLAEKTGVSPEDVRVEMVAHEAADVITVAHNIGCETLMIVYKTDEKTFQRGLFEASMTETFWVSIGTSARDAPEQSTSPPSRVFAMCSLPTMLSAVISQRLLGITVTETLCAAPDLESQDVPSAVKAAMKEQDVGGGDLVLCGVDDFDSNNRIYRTALALLEPNGGANFALVHVGHSFVETIAASIQLWAATVAPPMEREQRIELATDLKTGSEPNVEFFGLISASAMLAAFGLLQDSAAVIIGAMLIAPLMTPIVGAGLALAQGNRPLFQRAVWTVLLGFCSALVASILFGWLVLLFQEPRMTGEMLARSRPSPLDFCVGLVGGIAASYARTRKHLSSALAGAAIAAALVPPISTAGLQIAFHVWTWEESPDGVPVLGPLLLVSANVLTIMIGSSFVLWARGMRSDRAYGFTDRWTLRTIALLLTLILLTLIWIIYPRYST